MLKLYCMQYSVIYNRVIMHEWTVSIALGIWRLGPLLLTWFNFNPNFNQMHCKMWGKIIDQFLNFNGCECMINFTP